MYAISATTLLSLLHMQQLCGAFWSPLPLGGPVHWIGNCFDSLCHHWFAVSWGSPCYSSELDCICSSCSATTVISFSSSLRQLFFASMCLPSRLSIWRFWWVIITILFGRPWRIHLQQWYSWPIVSYHYGLLVGSLASIYTLSAQTRLGIPSWHVKVKYYAYTYRRHCFWVLFHISNSPWKFNSCLPQYWFSEFVLIMQFPN